MRLSVIIPTRDRAATLARTLAALAAQAVDPDAVELIVVDNGSRDSTPTLLGATRMPFALRVLQEGTPGASQARNTGLAAARGDLVLFLGDDTAPAAPELFAGHLALHEARPEPTYAVLGHVNWSPALDVTPFMRWLELGPQFAYAVLPPGPAGPQHFYTAHVSVKRELLTAVDGFDPRLPFLFEDAELGARLVARGMVLDHRPELVVLHDHAMTLSRWMERQVVAGRAARQAIDAGLLGEPIVLRPEGPRWLAVRAVARAIGAPQHEWRALPAAVRNRLYWIAHYGAYARGFFTARSPAPASG